MYFLWNNFIFAQSIFSIKIDSRPEKQWVSEFFNEIALYKQPEQHLIELQSNYFKLSKPVKSLKIRLLYAWCFFLLVRF